MVLNLVRKPGFQAHLTCLALHSSLWYSCFALKNRIKHINAAEDLEQPKYSSKKKDRTNMHPTFELGISALHYTMSVHSTVVVDFHSESYENSILQYSPLVRPALRSIIFLGNTLHAARKVIMVESDANCH